MQLSTTPLEVTCADQWLTFSWATPTMRRRPATPSACFPRRFKMADMHLTVSNSAYDHDKFDVSVTGLNHSDARQLVDIGNKLIFREPVNAPSPRLEGSDLTHVQERAMIEAAKLFFASKRDKISTIKFIRE